MPAHTQTWRAEDKHTDSWQHSGGFSGPLSFPKYRCYYLSFPSVLEVFSSSGQGIPDEPPNVVPNVRIPEWEERRPPRQCNWQKGEVYYWLEPGPSAASNTVVQVREPRAQVVTQIYRVSTCSWFKWIGYKFAKQFHWSKLLLGWDFPGGFCPIPNFLIGKQRSVLSES